MKVLSRMVLRLFLPALTWLLLALPVSGQVPVGKWRAHLSWSSIQDVSGSDERIFAAASNGILIYHKEYNNTATLHKINKLSDAGISAIGYARQQQLLVVGYRNGNLDVWKDGSVRNYPAIRDQMFYSSKRINSMAFYEGQAWLACDFGVVAFDLSSGEFVDTYSPVAGTDVPVLDLEHHDQAWWAATSQGLYRAPDDAPDLDNPARWEQVTAFADPDRRVTDVLAAGANLLFSVSMSGNSERVFYINPQGQADHLLDADVQALEPGSNSPEQTGSFYICASDRVYVYESGMTPVPAGTLEGYAARPVPTALFDDGRELWIGDAGNGLIRYRQGSAESIVYNGPPSDRTFVLKSEGSDILGVGGGYDDEGDPMARKATLYRFSQEQWNSYQYGGYTDFTDVVPLPEGDRLMVASWGSGLLEVDGDQVLKRYDQDNSPLETYQLDQVRVGDLCRDRQGNLWMVNDQAEDPVKILKNNGSMVTASYDALKGRRVRGLFCGEQGFRWGYLHNTPLVFAVDPNGTPADPSDDQVMIREVLNYNGQSFAKSIHAMDKDTEGNIWIATDEGVAVDYDPGAFFERDDYRPNRIRMTVDGYTQYILRDNKVKDIGVDAGNRKWIATEQSGVYVFSEDTQQMLAHYRSSTSPLLSDSVQSLSINDEGMVFFATAAGICSYRSEASAGRDNFSDAYVFPNPVRPGYDGKITITNLVRGVNVKITDISGNLVYETVAKGGQATWDGRNFAGHRVASGVYLVFMTNEDGSKTHVGKLLFLK
jgi:ligand-binding sensor domain-containing protein